jgi:hypothetical protein
MDLWAYFEEAAECGGTMLRWHALTSDANGQLMGEEWI